MSLRYVSFYNANGGIINEYGINVKNGNLAVRPAMWINMEACKMIHIIIATLISCRIFRKTNYKQRHRFNDGV